jgi:integrase/recombinase XerD
MLYQIQGYNMSKVKVVIRQKPNSDGTLPLCLRITKDRKSSYIYLGHSIKEGDWDKTGQRVKKSHPNSVRLNNFILKKLSEATNSALEIATDKPDLSVKAVKNKIKPTAGSTFNKQAEAYLERLKQAGKYNQYTSDKPRVKHFKDFLGGDIAFPDVTPALLERFNAYVRSKLKLSERSAVNHLVMVRSVFSQAIKDNVVDAKHYPFGKGKVKIKFPDSIKIGLTPEEVKALEDVELTDPTHNHARNLWLFSFYFAGIRVSDVLRMRWTDIQNKRLHYTMGKNNKAISLKIPDKAIKIIDQYKSLKENKNDLIFPDLKGCDFDNKFTTQRTIAFKTSAIDKCLRLHVASKAGIEKKLTMHIARHSFAQNATSIDVRTLQMLFRHTKLETTEGYMGQFLHKTADDALDSVLAFEPS